MDGYELEVGADGVAVISFDLPGRVNVMNDDFLAAMDQIATTLESHRTDLQGVIITSAKRVFFAGGDLALMGQAQQMGESTLLAHFERLKGYFRRLERLELPVVAALNGTALGGGFELALACNYRITCRRSHIEIGLPEVGFCILPGAGGVVRLTGLIGLDLALSYLLTGKKVDAETALNDGLVDELVDDEETMMVQARAWISTHPKPAQPWDQKPSPARRMPTTHDEAALMHEHSTTTDELAVQRIREVALESCLLDIDAALRLETRALVELMVRPEAAARIETFFASRQPA